MSYSNFSNPPGGYANTTPAKPSGENSNMVPKAARDLEIPVYGKKGEFTEKKVYTDGVGNYHVNHFIGYFNHSKSPTESSIKSFNTFFFEKFYQIFNRYNVAKIGYSDYKYNGKKTLMFSTGGSHEKLLTIYDSPLLELIVPKVFLITPNFSVLGGIFHKDWVSIEMLDDGLSFFGSTLKRNWAEEQEIENVKNLAAKAIASGIMDQVTAFKFALNFIEVNQHHFLAGRRSWAVGYNKQLKKWYVETMAFERNSQCEYSMLEKTGILREQILNIWINLLVNFTKYLENFDLLPLSETDNPYEFKELYTFSEKRVAYKVSEGKSAIALLQKPWVANALKRHPGLIKGL